ncbi:SEC-C domain-containing protein [Actinocorallia longicatena]|uniref:SEC-C motif-containing protein n=1 Tax=Actinocorallia longicatena TaxID=111803 RepID=A0ABP6Q4C6_9ACTN
MLSDDLFNPLDLDDALEQEFERGGPPAAIALLQEALDDPRSLGDEAVPEYLDELIDQLAKLERYPEAIEATYRLIDIDESAREEELGAIAHLHALNGDALQARDLLVQLRGQSDPLQGLMNTLVMANELKDEKLAVQWLRDDLLRGLAEAWDPDLIRIHNGHLRRLGGLDEELELAVETYLGPSRPVVEHGRLPQGPRYVYPGTDRLEIERAMRGDQSARIVSPEGHHVPWPPERNGTCWCGSGTKYKKCCGRPGV